MSSQKKVLVPGGTGAMGVYLVPELLKMGYKVDVVSLDDRESDNESLRYFKANFKDENFVNEILKNDYDAIVDFMIYGTKEFEEKHKKLLESCGHYIYLSSYRIYAGDYPITENSPRLVDVSDNAEFLATDDYSLHKARGEDTLKKSGFTNWTAIRPAITYSKRRFQLVILEAPLVVNRALDGKKVVLPEEAREVQATMSWAGDVAKMISRLVLNRDAYGEIYTVATAEHNPWGRVADYYHELIGLESVWVPKEDFLGILSDNDNKHIRWQLDYDRLFERIVDNTKILTVTGMKQSELTTLHDGLKRELSALPAGYRFPVDPRSERMDKYLMNIK